MSQNICPKQTLNFGSAILVMLSAGSVKQLVKFEFS